MTETRPEESADHEAVESLLDVAFGGPDESRIIRELRHEEHCISWVGVGA